MNERPSVEAEDVATPAAAARPRRYLPAVAIILGAAAITASLFALYRDEADHHRQGSHDEPHSDGHQHGGEGETATSQAEADHPAGPDGSGGSGGSEGVTGEGTGAPGDTDPSGRGEAPVEAAPGDPPLDGVPPAGVGGAVPSTTVVPVVSTRPSSGPGPSGPTTSTTPPPVSWSGAGFVAELFDGLGLG